MGPPALPPALSVRRVAAADAAALADLAARTFFDAFGDSHDPANMAVYLATEFSPERVAAEIADPATTFLVAWREGRAVGYAKLIAGPAPACVTGPRPFELSRLYVEQGLLARGVGGALMAACLDEARRGGFATLWLGVWEPNARARRFYAKWGFREVGIKPFPFGDEMQEDLVLERPVVEAEPEEISAPPS